MSGSNQMRWAFIAAIALVAPSAMAQEIRLPSPEEQMQSIENLVGAIAVTGGILLSFLVAPVLWNWLCRTAAYFQGRDQASKRKTIVGGQRHPTVRRSRW